MTTPQAAAAEVAERAGSISVQTNQKVAGVIENMSAMVMPDGSTMDVFGSGGGEKVARRLSAITGDDVAVIGSVPLDPSLRIGGDVGNPIAISEPSPPTAAAINAIADQLVTRKVSIVGKTLGLGVK